jgi:hypothetical protein
VVVVVLVDAFVAAAITAGSYASVDLSAAVL